MYSLTEIFNQAVEDGGVWSARLIRVQGKNMQSNEDCGG